MRRVLALFRRPEPDFTVSHYESGVLIEAQNSGAERWLGGAEVLLGPAEVWRVLTELQDDGFTYQRV